MCLFEDMGYFLAFLGLVIFFLVDYAVFAGIGKWLTGEYKHKWGAIANIACSLVMPYREFQVRHIGHALLLVIPVIVTIAYFGFLCFQQEDEKEE